MNKRILFVCQFFYPEYISSATLPYDMALHFTERGYTVGVLCGYPKEYADGAKVPNTECINNICIHRIKYLQSKRNNIIGRVINYFSFSFGILCNFWRFNNYEIIYVFSNPPMLPAIVALIKRLYAFCMIFVSYDVYPELAEVSGTIKKEGIISKFMNYCNSIVFRETDWIVAICEDMKQYFIKHRCVDAEKVISIPNWHEDIGLVEKKKRADTHLFKEYAEDDFIVSYLGNMGTCQDMKTVMDCVKKTLLNKKIKYIFAGHGNKFDKIKQDIAEQDLINAQCFSYLKGEDFKEVLSISDCYIVSLIDGLCGLCAPSKTQSYLMQGRPVICIMDRDSEIAQDIIDSGSGYVFQNYDSDSMGKSIQELIDSNVVYQEKSNHARSLFFNKYEKAICLNKHLELLADCAKETCSW